MCRAAQCFLCMDVLPQLLLHKKHMLMLLRITYFLDDYFSIIMSFLQALLFGGVLQRRLIFVLLRKEYGHPGFDIWFITDFIFFFSKSHLKFLYPTQPTSRYFPVASIHCPHIPILLPFTMWCIKLDSVSGSPDSHVPLLTVQLQNRINFAPNLVPVVASKSKAAPPSKNSWYAL